MYWDQRTELYNRGEEWDARRAKYAARWLVQPLLGTVAETSLKAPSGRRLAVRRVALTPSYFVSDDHDYFENDDADERMVTFPPDHYRLEFARFTRL